MICGLGPKNIYSSLSLSLSLARWVRAFVGANFVLVCVL